MNDSRSIRSVRSTFKYPVQYKGLPTLDDVFEDLSRAGISSKTPEDVRHLPTKTYERAVEVFLRWFPHLLYDDDRRALVRLMTRPCALSNEVFELLQSEMERLADAPEHGYRWNVALGLYDIATRLPVPGPLSDLAFDPRFGSDRGIIIRSFGRANHHDIYELLVRLASDPDWFIVVAAVQVLSRLRDERAKPLLESLLLHASNEVRGEAAKALRKWNKRQTVTPASTGAAPLNSSAISSASESVGDTSLRVEPTRSQS